MAVVGVGAAAYAPAKYGLVTELVGPRQLVAANGWIEVSTVCAVLAGHGPGWRAGQSAAEACLAATWLPGQPALALALWLLLAALRPGRTAEPGVPDSGARYAAWRGASLGLDASFWRENRLPLARPRRRPLDGRDHPVLGRRGRAAVCGAALGH
jgi:LPLT family lysophospholipid transporter-like MFS transporter